MHSFAFTARNRVLAVIIAGAALLGYAVRLRLLTHGSGLAQSNNYDDGVYYAAAAALVHGRLPYADFLFLHPPGIAVALAPFAALGVAFGDPIGVAVARLLFLGIGAANCALIALIASRHSRTAAVVAGLGAAVFFPLAYSERSTLLEPLGTLALLVAVVLLNRAKKISHGLLAGCIAGVSIDVKAWYIVPVAIMVLAAPGRRTAFSLGAAISSVAIAAPFLLRAPSRMVQEVVLDQLGRPRSSNARQTLHRIILTAGDPYPGARGQIAPTEAHLIAAAMIALFILTGIAALSIVWARHFVAQALATSVVLLASPSFYLHYVAFAAPWIMIVVGVGTAALTRRFRHRATATVVVLVIGLITGGAFRGDVTTRARAQPVAEISAAFKDRPGCVISDDPGLLANANLLSADLARGCPLWPDVTGWTYDRDRANVARARNARWQRDAVAYLTSGDYFILARPATGLSSASLAYLSKFPMVARVGTTSIRSTRLSRLAQMRGRNSGGTHNNNPVTCVSQRSVRSRLARPPIDRVSATPVRVHSSAEFAC